jgi:predicted dienelactone hydrolase
MISTLHRALAGFLIAGTVIACSSDVDLPPAEPLAASPASVAALHGAAPGPHKVSRHVDVALAGTDNQRELAINLYYPQTGDNFPLLLFSHGNWSDKHSYDRLIEHWVSHGYVVAATDHLDCCGAVNGIFNSLRYGQFGLIETRVADLGRVLAAIPELETQFSNFRGKTDLDRIAATGHSFGAFTAQQLGGAGTFEPDREEYVFFPEPRITAVVALSPPGPMFDTITENSWQQLSTPTLVTTGTWDIQPSFWPDWRMHLMSYETAVPGDKFALVVEGADHYLGNLICRTGREAEPQEDALQMVQIATTTFLDAYLKNNPQATDLLAGDQLTATTSGFARLQRR